MLSINEHMILIHEQNKKVYTQLLIKNSCTGIRETGVKNVVLSDNGILIKFS